MRTQILNDYYLEKREVIHCTQSSFVLSEQKQLARSW